MFYKFCILFYHSVYVSFFEYNLRKCYLNEVNLTLFLG